MWTQLALNHEHNKAGQLINKIEYCVQADLGLVRVVAELAEKPSVLRLHIVQHSLGKDKKSISQSSMAFVKIKYQICKSPSAKWLLLSQANVLTDIVPVPSTYVINVK